MSVNCRPRTLPRAACPHLGLPKWIDPCIYGLGPRRRMANGDGTSAVAYATGRSYKHHGASDPSDTPRRRARFVRKRGLTLQPRRRHTPRRSARNRMASTGHHPRSNPCPLDWRMTPADADGGCRKHHPAHSCFRWRTCACGRGQEGRRRRRRAEARATYAMPWAPDK